MVSFRQKHVTLLQNICSFNFFFEVFNLLGISALNAFNVQCMFFFKLFDLIIKTVACLRTSMFELDLLLLFKMFAQPFNRDNDLTYISGIASEYIVTLLKILTLQA